MNSNAHMAPKALADFEISHSRRGLRFCEVKMSIPGVKWDGGGGVDEFVAKIVQREAKIRRHFSKLQFSSPPAPCNAPCPRVALGQARIAELPTL